MEYRKCPKCYELAHIHASKCPHCQSEIVSFKDDPEPTIFEMFIGVAFICGLILWGLVELYDYIRGLL